MFTWLFMKRPATGRAPSEAMHVDPRLPQEAALLLAGAGVPTYRQALPDMVAELARARRYSRPLSIVLVASGGPQPAEGDSAPLAGWGGHPLSPLGPVVLASLLREVMREEDLVSYAAVRQRCLVMMPEVALEEAQQAVERVTAVCAQRFGLSVRAGIAAYPVDGWTLDDLVSRAEATETDRKWVQPEPRSIEAVQTRDRRRDDPVGA
jgi:hypothetical protein